MADISEKSASGSTKIVGSDSSGNETNYLDIGARGDLNVSFSPTHQIDAFGRLRTSNPTNLFEQTFKYDVDFDLYWDTKVTNGGTVTHNAAKVSRFLNVTSTTGSKAIMQSRRRMHYYAGKSHLFQFSVNFRGAAANINKKMGLFDDNNGFFFYTEGTTLGVCIRSNVSGSIVDTKVTQDNWNGDKVDGTGLSEIIANPENGQLFWIDYAWLGIGGVRFGIYLGGEFVTLHTVVISNNQPDPYCKSPHLPYRLEIENMGGGAADEISAVCCAYEVEGEATKIGKLRPYYDGNTSVTLTGAEILAGFRINPSYPYASAKIEDINLVIETGNDEVVMFLIMNPTFTSGVSWNDEPNSIMQSLNNPNNEGYTGGDIIELAFIRTGERLAMAVSDIFYGFDIDEVPDTFIIVGDSVNGSADVLLNVNTREYY